ncbi:DNA replication protein DnaC [Fusobacterium naviforme]|nr:DNA replication protein DnaC [Fusobacterium naviforme]STO27630.1 DNA replication protein dnaC [Fusobacterium naviforme]
MPEQDSGPLEDSRKEMSKGITPDEARALGLRFKTEPPEATKCEFCGKTLQPRGLRFGQEVVLWIPIPPRCECEKAQEYWAEYDRQQEEKKRQEEEAERRRRLQERIDRLLKNSGIKKRFQQRTFENFRTDTKGRAESYKAAKEYADNWTLHRARGDGLYIEGTNGTGKTHLAAAIALQLIGEGVPVICKTSSDLLMDIKKTFDGGEISEAAVLDVYKKADLLIVDDLGKEQCSDWSMSTLYSIFNDRYEDMKPTIITTNYNADDLIKALTPRGYDNTKIVAIISRLRETSTVLTMAWADIRGGQV